ncbi:ABC transporter substrate-binding protein [Kribbella sandramycini]|uniref:ABC transporter substrate-binding protein n=1 Tax=Kribbella sandramycini TaxID=60450 RepID=A0A7Y4KXF6_9ACTN|nr:ABC transporter substrate-binding protein [Kribbella sandramycini]MBB6569738.1 peptide/nickel transport system substrate-binding protein [Kribbella sandramycini]NOL40433.1 ABC transporter substrate-binding protein [Kribbella sandramycini]
MDHVKRTGMAIATAVTLTLTAVACGGDDTGGASGGQSTGAGAKGGTVTVYAVNDPEHLDPARNFVTDSGMIGKLITRTLTDYRYDAKSKKIVLEKDLAESYESTPDFKTWTFTLKDGLKYEDGTPILAADIKYNVERSFAADMAEGAPYGKNYMDCAGYKGPYVGDNNGGKGCAAIEAKDEKTIVFKLNRAVPSFDGTTTMKIFAPVPKAKDTKTQYDNKPVSSGPYKIETYTRKKQLVLVRNTEWDAKTDPVRTALPDKFIFKFGDAEATVDQRLIADGAADQSSLSFAGVQPENIAKTNQANVKDRLVESTDICRRYIAFNQQKPLLKNQKLREALYYGLDRTSYRDGRGGERLAAVVDSVIPQDMQGYQPEETFKAPPEGDPEKAKALLKEAGYKGEKLTLATADSGLATKAAEAAQASWKNVGINVEIQKVPGDNYYSTQQQDSAAADLITAGWCYDWASLTTIVPSVFGPDATAPGKAAQNNYGRSQAGWDKMAEIAKESDKEKVEQGLADLYTEIMKTAPVVPTLQDLNVYVVGSNLDNVVADPNSGGLPDLTQIGVKKVS